MIVKFNNGFAQQLHGTFLSEGSFSSEGFAAFYKQWYTFETDTVVK